MLSLAAGMVGAGVVVVVEVELLVDESVVVGGLSRLLQPARPTVAAATSVAPSRPAIVRAVVGVVVVMV
jgi:hypothetical protein